MKAQRYSSYWNWVKKNNKCSEDGIYQESALSNPDSIEAPSKFHCACDELDAILEVLEEGGEQVLSGKEKQAFQYVVREGYSLRDAAKLMNVSWHSVYTYVKRGARKLRVLCQTKL